MNRAPRITGSDLISALIRAEFAVSRVKGSHHCLTHHDGRRTVVPVHSGETIGSGLLIKIFRDAQISTEDLRKLLH